MYRKKREKERNEKRKEILKERSQGLPGVAEHNYVALSCDWCELVQGGQYEHCGLAHAFISYHIHCMGRKEIRDTRQI